MRTSMLEIAALNKAKDLKREKNVDKMEELSYEYFSINYLIHRNRKQVYVDTDKVQSTEPKKKYFDYNSIKDKLNSVYGVKILERRQKND